MTLGRTRVFVLLVCVAALATLVIASLEWLDLPSSLREILESRGLIDRRKDQAYYRVVLDQHRNENGRLRPGCVVLLGNSQTELFPPAILENRPYVNRGISGDRARDVQARLSESVLTSPCEDVALLIGINDIYNERATPQYVVLQISIIIDRLLENGRRIWLFTLPPTRAEYGALNDTIRETSHRIVELASNHRHVYAVDLNTPLADEAGRLRSEYSADGLHLTSAAYSVWLALLDTELSARRN